MFARRAARRRDDGCDGASDLFGRVGTFLHAQGLSADPEHYALAHRLLTREDDAARDMVARLRAGVRLSAREIETLDGGIVPPGQAARAEGSSAPALSEQAETKRLVALTRAQVEAVAAMMRSMHDETRDFGRDLAESAAALGDDDAAAPDEVVRLTRAMIQRVADAETRLERATAETDSLRAALVEAQRSARCDPLTGLPNRRAFEEAFAQPPGNAGRCLALCDIDRFKAINDAFGHTVGDRVLRAVARVLADECRDQFVARQGGEEFVVLLGCSLGDAAERLNEVRAVLACRHFRARESDRPIGRVTFSAGLVAVMPEEDAEAALARADVLLYRAKAEGRDRIVAG